MLEQVCPCWRRCVNGAGLRFQKATPGPTQSPTHLSFSLSVCLLLVDKDVSSQLLLQRLRCPLPTVIIMDRPSDTVRKFPVKCFLLQEIVLVVESFHGKRAVTKTPRDHQTLISSIFWRLLLPGNSEPEWPETPSQSTA